MTPWILFAVVATIALPHLLPLHSAPPISAAALWLVSLSLRAMAGVLSALYLVLFFPGTELFAALTRWCTHAIIPLLSAHLGISGHRLGDAVALLPTLTLGTSAVWIVIGIVRGARTVRRMVHEATVGAGPHDSVIVTGSEVLLLAAGLNRPRVLVSAGALTQLEDDELAAGLAHERGHIIRRHRFVLLYGELCRAFARFQPGTDAAVGDLAFHLERDADAWVLRHRHDPVALAGAICKTALSRGGPGPALASLGGGGAATRRVRALIDGGPALSRSRSALLNAATILGATLAIALAAAVPSAIAAGQATRARIAVITTCPD